MQWKVFAVVLMLTCVSGVTCDESELREMYKKLAAIRKKFRFDPFSNLEPGNSCSGTPEESESWVYISNLFEDYEGGGGVLREVWPNWSFYEPLLNALYTRASLRGIVMCPVERKSEGPDKIVKVCISVEKACDWCHLLPRKGTSVNVTLERYRKETSRMVDLCKNGTKRPSEGDFKAERVEEVKGLIGKPSGGGLPGRLTGTEVLEWYKAIGGQETTSSYKPKGGDEGTDCSASPEMSLSAQYLKIYAINEEAHIDWFYNDETIALRAQGELDSHPEFYEEKLKWLKGADKTRGLCRGRLVCGWDGVCIKCELIKKEAGELLMEACNLISIYDWETSKGITTTTTTAVATTVKNLVQTTSAGNVITLRMSWMSLILLVLVV